MTKPEKYIIGVKIIANTPPIKPKYFIFTPADKEITITTNTIIEAVPISGCKTIKKIKKPDKINGGNTLWTKLLIRLCFFE